MNSALPEITSLLPFLSNHSLVLASASPRRAHLLGLLDLPFTVRPLSGIDESVPSSIPPIEVAEAIARKKASAATPADNEVIITADTVVVARDTVLGKPSDPDHARSMLSMLSDATHTVVTGVAIVTPGHIDVASASTQVTFASLSPDEIEFYISRFNPSDKAGAYGIQEWIGAIGISRIEGSFYNVMGLPLHLLYTMLRRLPANL